MADTKETMLIWTDPATNKNKFYHVVLDDSGRVTSRYGRVGEDGKLFDNGMVGEHGFESIVRKKKNKGYKEAAVVNNTSSSTSINASGELRDAVDKTFLAKNTDPRLVALIDRLVKTNAHEIFKASGGKLTVDDGQIRTPLGLLTKQAIYDARSILETLSKAPSKRMSLLADYMTLVPQNVGRGNAWKEDFLAKPADIADQASFLDQLEQSLDFAKTQSQASNNSSTSYDDLFKYSITPMDDQKVFDALLRAFKNTRKDGHSKSLYYAHLDNVYVFQDTKADEVFDDTAKKLGNVIPAWHGTRAMNLLSIASKGLKSPRESSSLVTTGAMFGRGIYSSTCSTKSLGYSDSGVWGGARTNTHYMFAVDVTLGNTYVPGKSKPSSYAWENIMDGKILDPKGNPYNSINAESGGAMGLRNPETIIPSASQLKIKYLLEFTSK